MACSITVVPLIKWMDRDRIYENAEGYDKGAYVSADSPYRNYFDFHNQAAWPYNNSYDGWWGHDTLPKLNYEGIPGTDGLCPSA